MARPTKGKEALTNDIKVRVDDKLLGYIDEYCNAGGETRADLLRMAAFHYLWERRVPQRDFDILAEVPFYLELADRYLEAADRVNLEIAWEQGQDDKGRRELIERLSQRICECQNTLRGLVTELDNAGFPITFHPMTGVKVAHGGQSEPKPKRRKKATTPLGGE